MSHRSAFHSAQYRSYFPAGVFSTLGSWTLRFLLGWSAWDLTHSATWVGIIAGLMLAPALLLSPLFGIVADRINPRNGLLLTVGLHAALASAAAIALLLQFFAIPALLVLSTALGITTSAHTPIRLALVPHLVPRESLPSAIGYSAITFNTSRILGPALGAWLLHVSSPAVAFSASAILMLGALPFLVAIPGVDRGGTGTSHPPFRRQLADGWHYARTHAAIRMIFGFTLVNALLGRTVIELLPALSGQLLNGDSTTLATLTASAGAGSILGGLIVSRQGGRESRLFGMMSASLALGAVLVTLMAWAGQVSLVALLVGLLSLITTIAGTTSQALAQLLVSDGFRGRVLSLWTMLAMGAPALGALVMGWAADRWSFTPVLSCFALVALCALAWLYRYRDDLHTAGPGVDARS